MTVGLHFQDQYYWPTPTHVVLRERNDGHTIRTLIVALGYREPTDAEMNNFANERLSEDGPSAYVVRPISDPWLDDITLRLVEVCEEGHEVREELVNAWLASEQRSRERERAAAYHVRTGATFEREDWE